MALKISANAGVNSHITNADGAEACNMSRAQTLAMLACRTGYREGKAVLQRRRHLQAEQDPAEQLIGTTYDIDAYAATITESGDDETLFIPRDIAAMMEGHAAAPDRATALANPNSDDWYWVLQDRQWWETYEDVDGLEDLYPNDRTLPGLRQIKKASAFQRCAREELRKEALPQKENTT